MSLVITLSGFERSFDVFTDEAGLFSYSFTPLSGESGIYEVRAVHPDLTDKPVHGQFVINRVSITPATINLSIPRNYEQTINIKVATGAGTEVNNLALTYDAADQPLGVYPEGVHVTVGDAKAYLAAKKTASLPLTIWADNTAAETGSLVLKVKSDESDPDAWGTIAVNTHFSEANPVLYFTPNHVETGVAVDDTVMETVVMQNKGLATMNDVSVAVLNQNGTPAPDWVVLNSDADLGSLAVGESIEVSTSFSPTAAVSEGIYAFYLRVESSNYPTTDINMYASVTQSGLGNVLVKVSDIYTGTLNENQEIIQGLSNAAVRLQNELVTTEIYNATTDGVGEAYFTDIPTGRYKCRVTANNHQEYIGRVWIKPGITAIEDVFLDYNLVTVEWEVTEITIEDSYEIVLTATYVTDVPAAVVVLEPASVSLPDMAAGDVYNGEFTMTNYGLIRADNVTVTMPPDDQYFAYELLGGIPDTIEAKERITVAYRVTCLQALDQEEEGTGGGCNSHGACASANYDYNCAGGQTTSGSGRHCMSASGGSCGGGGGSGGSTGGGVWSVSGGGGSGSSSGSAPSASSMSGTKCHKDHPQDENDNDDEDKSDQPPQDDDTQNNCDDNQKECTGSWVDLLQREYNRSHTDLSVKVPGGHIRVKRSYYEDVWHWNTSQYNLAFKYDALGSSIASIDKGGVIYEAQSTGSEVFIHDTYRIHKTDIGFRWQSAGGAFKEYDQEGRLLIAGSRRGLKTRYLYEAGEDGRLIGLADRNDRQVVWFEYDPDDRLSVVTDLSGRRVEYTYTNGLLTNVRDVLGNDTSHDYDGEGRIIRTVDAAGNESTVAYGDYGNVASVLDSLDKGQYFEFDYDQGKKESYARVTSSLGRVKEVWYDNEGDTIRVDVNGRTIESIVKDGRDIIVTDENGHVTRKEYDEWQNATRIVYPDGAVKSYEYERTFNKPTKFTNENGVVFTYEYDSQGNLTRMTEAEGGAAERITEYIYDSAGNRLTMRKLADADTAETLTTYTYDAEDNLATITDPEGHVIEFTSYDVMGNVLTREDQRDKLWTYEYDDAGRLTKVIDPMNHMTQMFYDENGNKIRQIDAENRETNYEYDIHDNLIKITDANAKKTLFSYNADNRLISRIDPEGNQTLYTYDNEGRLIKTTDGNGNETLMEYDNTATCSSCSGGTSQQPSRIVYPTFSREFGYDARNRKTGEKDVLSGALEYITQFAYDDKGNLVEKIDKEDKATAYAYDALNRLTAVTDPLNEDTLYTYDDRDNLLSLTDANGNTTWFEYDGNNRLVRETRPLSQDTTYAYDSAGNLIQKIDTKNQKTAYTYDDAGRLTEVKYFAVSTDTVPVKTVTFTYDNVGNLTGYNDGITTGTYVYDDLNRKTSESIDYSAFTKTNAYTYYDNGLKQTSTGPDSIAYGYLYNANNQLTGVQIPNLGFMTISEYEWNRPKTVILPGGSTRQYEYDPLMRVESILAIDPGQNEILNYQYTYDKMDNITAKATEHGEYGYGYDDLYRLNSVDNPPVANLVDEGFTYDNVGNRLTAADTTGTWSYNQNNELGGYDDVSYEYDANGNTIKKVAGGVTTSYVYNVEDRLAEVWDGEVTTGTLVASYYYDPFGRRLWKNVGGTRTHFHYSDEGLIGEYDAAGSEIKTYGYKPGSTWTTDPLFMKVGSQYYFYQNDHLGTPQKLTSTSGAVAWSAKYSSFGEATIDPASTVMSNLRFAGQYYDGETGLHYNYHRHYDPITGRYLKVDPIGIAGGINLYAYVSNNPITGIDPLGLEECNNDCPGGQWEGSSSFGIAAFFGGGGSVDRVFWSCKSSNVTCEAVYFCFGGGAIGEASLDFVGAANATGAYNRQDLTGWSSGWRGSIGVGGAGVSGTRTGSIDSPAVIEHGSGGLSAGGGAARITCTTLSTTCD